jgi:drug/metabolite transporter (DMT)-like permease
MVPGPGVFFTLTIFGFVTTVISISTLVYAIKLIGSTPTAILGGLDPLTAVVISVVMFGEKLTGNLVAGMVLILVGVTMIVVIDSRKEKGQH